MNPISRLDLPPSFRGEHGKIVYKLEAKMCRSWRANSVSRQEITFVNKFLRASATVRLWSPQVGSVEKKVGTLHKGLVKLEASVDKGTCCPGEKTTVVAKVNNSSSKKITPKFKMVQEVVYHAQGHTRLCSKELCRVVGNVMEPNTNETITCQMDVPVGQCQTIDNCEIISLHYHIKAYLDISFAFDPEVHFPMVMLPVGLSIPPPFGAVGPLAHQVQTFRRLVPYQPQGFGSPTHSDFPLPCEQPQSFGGATSHRGFPPPVAPMGDYPAVSIGTGMHSCPAGYSSEPPAYEDFQKYPSYSNPMPQQTPSQPGFPVYSRLQTAPPVPNPSLPTAPTFNFAPNGPAMNFNFLSEQKEEPPSNTHKF